MKLITYILPCVCAFVLSACVTTGGPSSRILLPAGAPDAAEILAALEQNDGQIRNFQGTGTLILESPEFAATQVLRQTSIAYQTPDALSIVGRKHGTVVFELTSAGSEFLIELPTERDYYYRIEGEQFAEVPFSVAPGEIAREMFLPQLWASFHAGDASVVAWQPETQTATLLLDTGDFPTRRIQVTGPPWILIRSELLAEDGEALAVTTREDYREVSGLRFPGKVIAEFPGEEAMMSLAFRNLDINTDLDASAFDVRSRAQAVQQYLEQEFGIER